jgi:hypothetical protein
MKKSLKTRLILNRETLRALDADQMAEAQGGMPASNTACYTDKTCPSRCGQWYCTAIGTT